MVFFRYLAVYVGGIMGAGLLGLPSIAYQQAGAASLIAWIMLIILGAPIGLFFAALAHRFPDDGGIAGYAERVFGRAGGTVCGYWFYFAIPLGGPATAHIAASIVIPHFDVSRIGYIVILLAIFVGAVISNLLGFTASTSMQLAGTGVLLFVLYAAFGSSIQHVRVDNFAGLGDVSWSGVFSALLVIFFAFAGWEALANFATEVTRIGVGLRRLCLWTIAVISVTYLLFSVISIGVLGPMLGAGDDTLGKLLAISLGESAFVLSSVVALVLAFVAVNTFVASAGRLGVSLSRRGVLPRFIRDGADENSRVRRSVLLLAALGLGVCGMFFLLDLSFDSAVEMASALFVIVTITGVSTALVTVCRTWTQRGFAALTIVILLLTVLSNPAALLVPVVLGGAGLMVEARLRGTHGIRSAVSSNQVATSPDQEQQSAQDVRKEGR